MRQDLVELKALKRNLTFEKMRKPLDPILKDEGKQVLE